MHQARRVTVPGESSKHAFNILADGDFEDVLDCGYPDQELIGTGLANPSVARTWPLSRKEGTSDNKLSVVRIPWRKVWGSIVFAGRKPENLGGLTEVGRLSSPEKKFSIASHRLIGPFSIACQILP